MLSIKGDLGMMDLSELLQWAETGRKDGSLLIHQDGISKYYFFQDGKLIYFSSQQESERLGDFLTSADYLTEAQLMRAMSESKKLGIPFVAYLISENIIAEKTIRKIMEGLLRESIAHSLNWKKGKFQFREVIPETVLNSPVKLNITKLLITSAIKYDEINAAAAKEDDPIFEELVRRIQSGRIELPPTPDLLVKINRLGQEQSASFTEIGKIIEEDQILASKILKVVNSSFYNLAGEITSIQRAISIIGLSSVKSIATAHSLSRMSAATEKKIVPVLQHSLLTAFVAKKLAAVTGENMEDAFVCGILHDIGKTVLINFLDSRNTEEKYHNKLLDVFHARIGYLLAKEWKFSEIIRHSVRLHHSPGKAKKYARQIYTIYYADKIANENDPRQLIPQLCEYFSLEARPLEAICNEAASLKGSTSVFL